MKHYIANLSETDQAIGQQLVELIDSHLSFTESKIWHAHPVWFIDGNPIVGFSKQKAGMRLMFWSGADFEEPALKVRGDKFKDASIFYTSVSEINTDDLKRWLQKSETIQWDYKNLIKRKGVLVRL
ncbi:MAG: DUF1801 domain-containing protein [Flavobacterium sp.]|nr:DUF1801 domain-containing protein [Flavobacterium sp.]